MSILFRDRGVNRRVATGLVLGAVVALGACGKNADETPAGPSLPGDPGPNPTISSAAFIFDVNTRKGTVTVKAPEAKLNPSIARLGTGAVGRQTPAQPLASILSNDVISISTSNFTASAVGAVAPNKVRVQFDVQVQNILPGINLVTPTFPTAPTGANGMLLIPFSTNVTVTSGGTGTENGNVVVVELPSRGEVQPSIDWNGFASLDQAAAFGAPGAGGDPYNFFNDAACAGPGAGGNTGVESDCYRWEQFGPIAAGAISASRRVGFDIDATVGEFRARLIAVADLQPSTGPVTGDANITVTSPERGPLQGVTVAVTGAAATQTTSASGVASFTGLGLGSRAVTISNLPSGCGPAISPANGSPVTISTGTPAALTYSVTCATIVGTVAASITRTGTGTQSLAGVTYAIDPDAAGLANVVGTVTGTGAAVSFSAIVPVGAGAGAGAGAVSLGNLPSGCTAPAPSTYSGLADGTTVNLSISISCAAPAARYAFASRWTAPAAGTVDLIVSFDNTSFNDPNINGALVDPVGSYTVVTNLAGLAGRLTAVSGIATSPAGGVAFGAATTNFASPNVGWTTGTTTPGGQVSAQDVATLRFTIGAGAATTITTTHTISEIATPLGDPFNLVFSGAGQNIDVTAAPLSLPAQ